MHLKLNSPKPERMVNVTDIDRANPGKYLEMTECKAIKNGYEFRHPKWDRLVEKVKLLKHPIPSRTLVDEMRAQYELQRQSVISKNMLLNQMLLNAQMSRELQCYSGLASDSLESLKQQRAFAFQNRGALTTYEIPQQQSWLGGLFG